MKKFIFVFSMLVLSFGVFFSAPQKVEAAVSGDSCSVIVYQKRGGETCYLGGDGCVTYKERFFIRVENLVVKEKPYTGKISVWVGYPYGREKTTAVINGVGKDIVMAGNMLSPSDYEVTVRAGGRSGDRIKSCDATISFSSWCEDEKLDKSATEESSCLKEVVSMNDGFQEVPFELCNQIGDEKQNEKCIECFEADPSGIWTAVGCIPTNAESIVATFIKIGLSIGGGVTLLLILAGSFQLSVSQGDPKKTSDAKEQITSAIIGLVFIILSVTILQFIGVTLFQIPGFGG